jgi:hypothetical protein
VSVPIECFLARVTDYWSEDPKDPSYKPIPGEMGGWARDKVRA